MADKTKCQNDNENDNENLLTLCLARRRKTISQIPADKNFYHITLSFQLLNQLKSNDRYGLKIYIK